MISPRLSRRRFAVSHAGAPEISKSADGKQPGYSMGATLTELAKIVQGHGAHNAIRLDEGGSNL